MDDYIEELGKSNSSKNDDLQAHLDELFPSFLGSTNRLVEDPMVITDAAGSILAWFLPDLISTDAQVLQEAFLITWYILTFQPPRSPNGE